MKSLNLIFIYSFISLFISFDVDSKAPSLPKVFIKVLEKEDIFDVLIYPLQIRPSVQADILADTQGVLVKLPVRLGEPVKVKQSLAKVKNNDPVYQFRAVDHSSPISGVVSHLHITEGTMVSKGQKILTITNPEKLLLEFEIPASDLGELKIGNFGEMSFRGSDKVFKVKISGIGPVVDPLTGTSTARLTLLDPLKRGDLFIGTIGKVTFKSNHHKGMAISKSVISYKGKKPVLKVVDQETKRVKRVPVTLGKTRRGRVEIVKGMKSGDWVIERSSGFIKELSQVEIKNFPTSPKTTKKPSDTKATESKATETKAL